MSEVSRVRLALSLAVLMAITPFANATMIDTFANGASEVEIVVKDSQGFVNQIDGKVTLSSDESVISAELGLSTSMVKHQGQIRYDADTLADPWLPSVTTGYSDSHDFSIDEKGLGLTSGGFTTDFEFNDAEFTDTMGGMGWSYSYLDGGIAIPEGCSTGDWCWGTTPFDLDNNYTNDIGGTFEYRLQSPEIEVLPGGELARFSSWFGMHWSHEKIGQNWVDEFYDCAYVRVRNSTDGVGWSQYSWTPFTWGAGTGATFSPTSTNQATGKGGLHSVGFGNGNIQSCSGVGSGEFAVAGESDGWGTLALDLSKHVNATVQLEFVMEHNGFNMPAFNNSMPGWFIDDFRLGETLPQHGWANFSNWAPTYSPNNPDGYGLLSVEYKDSPTGDFYVDIVSTDTKQVVIDKNGKAMTGLRGDIIELWDVDTDTYPYIDVVFHFDSGPSNLATPILYGYSLGTRVGIGFNQSIYSLFTDITDGVWNVLEEGGELYFTPVVSDDSFNPARNMKKFSQPITAITPVVQDNCPSEDANITINYGPESAESEILQVGTKWSPDKPINGFDSIIRYTGTCGISAIWFDLEFGHNARSVTIDVAGDGDLEWGMNQEAFGAFGRQTAFSAGRADSWGTAFSESTITLDNLGEGVGAGFVLPKGADVILSDFVIDNNNIFYQDTGFNLSIVSSGMEVVLGVIDNVTTLGDGSLGDILNLSQALNSLQDNPAVSAAYADEYGNEWYYFELVVSNNFAITGSSVTIKNLDILYDWSVTLSSNHNLARELNQGIALGAAGASVDVPIKVSATSGGSVKLSNLGVLTASGYQSTIEIIGNPVGLYPTGEIIEVRSTHTVDPSTGASFSEARLLMESDKGVVELSYYDNDGFEERSDIDDYLTMEASNAMLNGNTMEITWRFTVNPNWEDTQTLHLYANLIASNGNLGIPGALILAPPGSNAVENDAGITSFELQNSAGIVQDLLNANSSRTVTLVGSIELEGLDSSPDPNAYYLAMERKLVSFNDSQLVIEWLEVANISGPIGGDFNWEIDLGFDAAGIETYRFRMTGYEGGDTLCPDVSLDYDGDCAIDMNISIDNYAPSFITGPDFEPIEFYAGGSWVWLKDNGWITPSLNQQFRVTSYDIPLPPNEITMYYWVQASDDANGDGIADASEYKTQTLFSDEAGQTVNYTGSFSDDENSGMDPEGKVSIYFTGTDLAGNQVNGGGPGLENDLVNYASMSQQPAVITSFQIADSSGQKLYNADHPESVGKWNYTMYAGNVYHLQVNSRDANGWSDVDYYDLTLGATGDWDIKYWPNNNTVYSSNEYLTLLVDDGNGSLGPMILDEYGDPVVDPYVSVFTLDIPIMFDWNIPGLSSTSTPTVRIKDYASGTSTTAGGQTYVQKWAYSDDFRLDFRSGVSPTFTDISEPITSDTELNFVYPGDTILFEGKYAFVDGISSDVYILPEVPMTLRITREAALADGVKGYFAWPSEVIDIELSGGALAIPITAPLANNEYTYNFELVDIPTGAQDFTAALCQSNAIYGCSTFTIKVDGVKPEIAEGSWQATAINDEVLQVDLPSSTINCVDIRVAVDEDSALVASEISLKWGMYLDPQTNTSWKLFKDTFSSSLNDDGSLSTDMELSVVGGNYLLTADCVDLWPNSERPTKADIENVNDIDIIFWIDGRDSAGWAIDGGGIDSEKGVQGIVVLNDPAASSNYNLIYEEARFEIDAVRMTPSAPKVGDIVTLEITVRNAGTKAGNITLEINSVVNDGFPVNETTVTSQQIEFGQTVSVYVNLEEFTESTTGMYLLVIDSDSDKILWNGSEADKGFSIRVSAVDNVGGVTTLLFSGLGGLVLILLVVIVVLIRRSKGGEEFYEDYDDGKSYANIPTENYAAPQDTYAAPSGGSEYASDYGTGGYGTVDPKMAEALATFPQWDQGTIQGYFDMGWDIETLKDWVEGNS